MRSIAYLALTAALVLLGASSALAAPVTVCGTLQALTRNVSGGTSGSATIDGRTFILTEALSTNGTNRVDPDVRVGERVCLTAGNLINTTGPRGNAELVENFVLASCSGSAAPTSCVQSLPSTATDPALGPSGAAISSGPLADLQFDPLGSGDGAANWIIVLAGPALVAAFALMGRRILRSN